VRAFASVALLPALLAAAGGTRPAVTFTDQTAAAGIRFRHENGAFGKKYLPETMGAGVAVLDFDGDGHPDLLFANSRAWPGRGGPRATPTLYRNRGDGTFADVTQAAGLGFEMYGMGVAAADYDNDGRTDVYLTGLGGNRLLHNEGGRFSDVTRAAGVAGGGFSTGAAFFDYDNDGRLDLLVTNYVQWSEDKDLFCTLDGRAKSYCTPESYTGDSATLYRNAGGGRFEDVTERARLRNASAKALGIALLDYDGDGWTDVFLANDTQPNNLYRNNRDGTFSDAAMRAGVAFSEAGVARAGMGVDAADYDGSGRPSLVIGNFANEMVALYHNEGTGLFIDEAPTSTIGQSSLLSLTFGCFFFDYDLDGRLDIFAVNGHVADDIEAVQSRVKYAQPPHLFRNLGGGRFEDVSAMLGEAFRRTMVGRGAAYADLDGDGDLDVVVTTNGGPARLLRNEGGNRNHWLRIRLRGTRSNRDGIGAKVTVVAGGAKQWALVRTGSSYLSQSDLAPTFGLGAATKAHLEVTWPSGRSEVIGELAADREVLIEEGRGAVPAGR
jgi:enediyne biosynthesis protein E4